MHSNAEKQRRMRHRVQRKVYRAIRDGYLIPEPCLVCGNRKVDAHHEDYDKPLEVTWLCRTHHNQRHRRRKPMKVKRESWRSPKWVARELDLTTATITRWCRQGKFPNARKIGRIWRIREDDIGKL